MNTPVDKNRTWMASIYGSIGRLDQSTQAAIMKPAGEACALDIRLLSEKYLGRPVNSVEDLVSGWNSIREKRNLTGRWETRGSVITGVFGECGCPLVRSGLVELHPVQCYCSQGMMEAIFSRAAKKPVKVTIKRAIGRGDDACEFEVEL